MKKTELIDKLATESCNYIIANNITSINKENADEMFGKIFIPILGKYYEDEIYDAVQKKYRILKVLKGIKLIEN